MEQADDLRPDVVESVEPKRTQVRFPQCEAVPGTALRPGWSCGWAHRSLLDLALPDVQTLIDLHAQMTGTGPGSRPREVQVLSRSAIVLACAYWEAFCEDLIAEALNHFAKHAKTAAHLPNVLKKTIGKSLDTDKHELAMWAIADDGWRDVLRARAVKFRDDADRSLNSPKTREVKNFFEKELGLEDVTKTWSWSNNPVTHTTARLDNFVALRGTIAHRGAPNSGVRKSNATQNVDLVRRLGSATAHEVNIFVYKHTGKAFQSYAKDVSDFVITERPKPGGATP